MGLIESALVRVAIVVTAVVLVGTAAAPDLENKKGAVDAEC